MNDFTDNPYRGALLIVAVVATLVGLLMLMLGSPDPGEMISTAQAVGILLVNAGLLCGAFWIAVSALLWQKERVNAS